MVAAASAATPAEAAAYLRLNRREGGEKPLERRVVEEEATVGRAGFAAFPAKGERGAGKVIPARRREESQDRRGAEAVLSRRGLR
jgi:hypothetical protein